MQHLSKVSHQLYINERKNTVFQIFIDNSYIYVYIIVLCFFREKMKNMEVLGNLLKNAIGDGISKGISKAAERVVAPKAEAYANKVADSLDEATKAMEKNVEAQENFIKDWKAKPQVFRYGALEDMILDLKRVVQTLYYQVKEISEHIKNW